MRLLRASILLVLVLVLGSCDKPNPPTTRRSHEKDVQAASVMVGANRIEVYRVNGKIDDPIAEGVPNIDGFPILARGKDLGPEFAAKLTKVLIDESSYSDNFVKCFWPGVAYRACYANTRVDVVICFDCENFYLGPPRNEREHVWETATFRDTPARKILIDLAKEALPDDPDIQALK
jgi:hypothetical protein